MNDEAARPLMKTLVGRKDAIVQEWLARALQSYPEHTGRFLAREQDPFRNPVGRTLKAAFPALFDQLVGDLDCDRVSSILDDILRIRAVQDFSAGQAVAFLFLLKPVVREALTRGTPADPHTDGLAILEGRIDQMALLAFDLYMRCREQVYEIKANEARRRTEILLKRCGVEGRRGETENGGNGDLGRGITDSPMLRFAASPLREREKP